MRKRHKCKKGNGGARVVVEEAKELKKLIKKAKTQKLK